MDDDSVICGLAFGCPYNNRLEGCPLFYMDEKSIALKLASVEKMNEEEKREILHQHANCKNKHNGYEKW